jgi:hypothetical protein
MDPTLSPQQFVARCQKLMAHAWMVRTFIKHCEEVDDFPELSQIVRAVFDISRALDIRVDDPDAYVRMLRKKLPRVRAAVEKFARDAPLASLHTNFQQAVVSIQSVADDLMHLVSALPAPLPAASPPSATQPQPTPTRANTGADTASKPEGR